MIIGRNSHGFITVIYSIMGGSIYSQNRNLVLSCNKLDFLVKTDPIDSSPKWVPNPELTLYDAVRSIKFVDGTRGIIVSNGNQTASLGVMTNPDQFFPVLYKWRHEPDPAHTSRISALVHEGEMGSRLGSRLVMSIIQAKENNPEESVWRMFEELPIDVAGEGYFISTYSGEARPDGSIPAFIAERPVSMPLVGTAEDMAADYMQILSLKYRVGLVAMTFHPGGTLHGSCIINYGKCPPQEV